MPWVSKIEVLYEQVTGVLDGRYRPLDGVPFFRFLYPPEDELRALQEFRHFVTRLKTNGYNAETVSLFSVFKEALGNLVGAASEESLLAKLYEYERSNSRAELAGRLAEHLPEEMAEQLLGRLHPFPARTCCVLTRAGALFPFVRLSSLFSRLENKVPHVLVALYPGNEEGAMLGDRSFDRAAAYYRGEVL